MRDILENLGNNKGGYLIISYAYEVICFYNLIVFISTIISFLTAHVYF